MRRWLRTPLLVAAAFAGGAATNLLTASATPQGESPYLPFDQMGRVMVMVENGYVDVAHQDKLVDGAIKGMVAELDPHSSYMNPAEFADFQSDTQGKFGGIGVEVDQHEDSITVIAPIEGSPAARAGIQSGDRIVSVDGKLIRGIRIDKLVDLMRGDPGTKVRLGILRGDKPEIVYFDLVREVVHVASVEARRLAGDVLYVRLKQFQENTHAELLDAIAKVRSEASAPLTGVILDMRYNPGGLVDQAEGVADEIMNDGVIYSTRRRGEVVDQVEATRGGALADLPVVALVNEYSASAAELVAGALQDSHRATIVGAQTFGKGSVQTIFDLPGGAGLRLTTMRYYTPSGRSIQAQGILPDVIVRPANAKPDEVVRESDLEGHLAAETGGATHPTVTVEGPAETIAAIRVAEIPADPTTGKDFTLAEGYRRLREKAKSSGAREGAGVAGREGSEAKR